MWAFTGTGRPPFAETPGPGQESVWDYPRPPALETLLAEIRVQHGSQVIAQAANGVRVLETASPPTVYIEPADVRMNQLVRLDDHTYCEWKGLADYWALADDPNRTPIGWSYPRPRPAFEKIRDWLCFYPGRVDCFIDGEAVRAQSGRFYGGWITDRIVGPFKGDPGTAGW